jgi:CheY-like chemotaxis protein
MWAQSMSMSQAIAPHLPSLRRFARALSGSQESGDADVVALLEALVETPSMFLENSDPKIALYRLFLKVSNSAEFGSSSGAGVEGSGMQTLRASTPKPRQAFLLLAVEGFEPGAIATILETDTTGVANLVATADQENATKVNPVRVVIIEDEPLTALDLKQILEHSGHRVVGMARTHREAVTLAKCHAPELILTSVMLADGSSGVEAVNEILETLDVPIILISAHPVMYLTGAKPEPTFAIAKPFNQETVRAIVAQALLCEGHARPRAREQEGGLNPR